MLWYVSLNENHIINEPLYYTRLRMDSFLVPCKHLCFVDILHLSVHNLWHDQHKKMPILSVRRRISISFFNWYRIDLIRSSSFRVQYTFKYDMRAIYCRCKHVWSCWENCLIISNLFSMWYTRIRYGVTRDASNPNCLNSVSLDRHLFIFSVY
jgi:hypothetical protein